MTVITRFAPSPTGFLHIGNARTALFSRLFARHNKGKFLLRIEDTDRERWSQAAVDAIHDGMNWLGLDYDGEVVYQYSRKDRHKQVAEQLLAEGKAYKCYSSQEELNAMREAGFGYDRKWRDKNESDAPQDATYAVRLKSPLEGEIIVKDHVRGDVRVPASQIEDLVILRSDGTPTYNLAVVVDDHDMGVTHIIRGEDHLTNAAKQIVIYRLMGWNEPEFAHIPLIHGADGGKLSKRHGALGVSDYRDMGYLPEALQNYLLRLGWSHGNDEFISQEQAIEWFSLQGIGKSPSRFDFAKLDNLNAHYIREAENSRLVDLIIPILQKTIEFDYEIAKSRLPAAMNGLKQRAKTLLELADNAAFYVRATPLQLNEKAATILSDAGNIKIIDDLLPLYSALQDWSESETQNIAKAYGEANNIKLGNVAAPLRAALTGSNISPSVFDIMQVLGKAETIKRIEAYA